MQLDRKDLRRALAVASPVVVLWCVAMYFLLLDPFGYGRRPALTPIPPLEGVCFRVFRVGFLGFAVAGLIPHMPFWVVLAVGGGVNLAVFATPLYLLLRLWSFLQDIWDQLKTKWI